MKNRCVRKRNHHSRLSILFFSEPVSHYQSAESILEGFSLILKMAEQRSAEDFTEFIDFLTSIVERTASVYRACDHVGLEICARKLEEHTRMLIAISLLQNSSLGDLFEVLEVSLAMLWRKTSDILHASSVRPKENAPLAFSASTGGRPVHIITKEMIEQLREP